jgi:CheY-like chemotaxis protein
VFPPAASGNFLLQSIAPGLMCESFPATRASLELKPEPSIVANKRIILLVDDNPEDVLLLKEAFKRNGYDFPMIEVPNGEKAILYLKGQEEYSDRTKFPVASLVLLDLKMPGVDGFEVLKWIRQHPEWRCVPVIVLTTSFYGPDIERAYDLGANSFLTKPADFDQYVASVRNIGEFWLSQNILPEPGPFVELPGIETAEKAENKADVERERQPAKRKAAPGRREKGTTGKEGKKLTSPGETA